MEVILRLLERLFLENMLLQQKPTKRHSFSIESLAISSRVEDNERDTDSPYLDYLQYKEACTDINSNVTSKTPAQVHYGMGSSHSQRSVVASMPQATSTPIADGHSRYSFCFDTYMYPYWYWYLSHIDSHFLKANTHISSVA